DSNGTAASGQFVVNGAPQTGGHEIDVTPANVGTTVFDVGTAGGTDTLWAQLLQNDGSVTGWQQFTISVPVPTLSVSSVGSAMAGQIINLSNLVTIADLGSAGYQKLELWDSNGTASGGQFKINGVVQTGGHEIDVSPANVSTAVFLAGSSGGTDTLWAQLVRNDGSVTGWQQFSVAVPTPTLSVASIGNATAGQTIGLSSLMSIADPGNAGYQKLQLWDSDGTPAGGEFLINGVAQTGGHTINVPSGANVVYAAGTSAGTDTMWAQLIQDNGAASGWQPFTVTVPNPTLAVHNFGTATPGQTIALSSLVTIADPGNAGYRMLELWDSFGTAATGQFVVNGSAQTGGHEIDVSPANVANVVFNEGTTGNTDTLWAQLLLNNGTTTGWQQFTVVDPITIDEGATLELAHAYAGHAIFAGSSGTLQLDDAADFSGTVAGMAGTDTLDLRDISFGCSTKLGYTANAANTGGTLSLSDGTHAAEISLLGQYVASSFVTYGDGQGGTQIQLHPDPVAMLAHPQHA
ncbi:hypothetical protein XH88_02140, partial [Bradyrhizobium sp. CCBAU 51627]|nr:hypothetical protein [Bradyrhizobium sp. CCBAU 51627]